MLISLESDLVVLGNRKCGSSTLQQYFGRIASQLAEGCTSVEGTLRRVSGYQDHTFTEETQAVLYNNIPKHYDAYQYRRFLEELGTDWAPLRKIVSIRNPWARMVSYYKWQTSPGKNQDLPLDSGALERFLMRYNKLQRLPLQYFTGCYDCDFQASNIAIVKVEDFDSRLPILWRELDLPLSRPTSVPVVNRRTDVASPETGSPSTPNYVAWYTETSRQFVQSLFSEDIRVGRYEFGAPTSL